MVDATGAEARAFLEQAPAPEDDGEILVIQADGGGAPHIDLAELLLRRRPRGPRQGTARHRRRRRRHARQRPRRATGDKSKNAKVAFVGVIYTLGPRGDDGTREGPIHKRIYATFESHAELFKWLYHEAVKRGYGTKRTLFLGDGDWRRGDLGPTGDLVPQGRRVHRLGPHRREAVGGRAVLAP
jgi:hypothetical protein